MANDPVIEDLVERINDLNESIHDLKDKLTNVSARVSKLENKLVSTEAKASDKDVFPFVKLDEAWADQQIKYDPKSWKGESQVGKTFSQVPVEYLDEYAGYYQWRYVKGTQDAAPKLDPKGKPYYERDKFTAKLARTWAEFKRQNNEAPW